MIKLKIGISACLIGEPVRYDAEIKLDPFLVETWGPYFDYVPVCPEVGSGLPVPREPSRLVKGPENPRMTGIRTGTDYTGRIEHWAEEQLPVLEREGLAGFIFKSRSPSCAMEKMNVYRDDRIVSKTGTGIWARMFMERLPLIPVEDERRLRSPEIRENFIERVFVFLRWREMREKGQHSGALVKFHARHKLILMAHSPSRYRQMGKLVAEAGNNAPDEVFGKYAELLAKALGNIAAIPKQANVLSHVLGYFKRELSPESKRELLDSIEQFQLGKSPLLVPVTLLNQYAREYSVQYLQKQYWLNPDPMELILRNHA